ncbi:MAG: GNAT family N-acetyltransferase [Bacilli bacterium]|nr:GNAT family N-acetyltransferase [Bacilli bacterium]
MKIIDLLRCEEKDKYLEKLKDCEWRAGKYLYGLVKNNELEKMCGENPRVFMLVDNDNIVSYCTYVNQDEIDAKHLFPWIGFVYTYPEYRGNRYFDKLLKHIIELAKEESYACIYLSTNEIGLYEKYGFIYFGNMLDITGNDSRIYRFIL